MSDSNNNLGELIDSARQDALSQQARSDALINQAPPPPRGKQVMTAVLLAVLAVVLFYQAPRFSQPYTWPDPATNSAAAEADLIELAGWIEAYRISKGQYPAVLSQVSLPETLAALVADTSPQYRPAEKSYTLEWSLPHWRATYDSQTEKVSIEPVGKH